MHYYKFTPLEEMNISIVGLSFISQMPTSTKAWQSSLAELQSLDLIKTHGSEARGQETTKRTPN